MSQPMSDNNNDNSDGLATPLLLEHHHEHQKRLSAGDNSDFDEFVANNNSDDECCCPQDEHQHQNDGDDDAGDDCDGGGFLFLRNLLKFKGPPQVVLLYILSSTAAGATMGIIPEIMGDRYATLYYGYDGADDCSSPIFISSNTTKPEACMEGSADAQSAAAISNFLQCGFKFLTGSLYGSLSDQYGRRNLLLLGFLVYCLVPFCLVALLILPNMNPGWYYYGFVPISKGLFDWMTVANSSIADVIPPRLRAATFGTAMAGFGVGVVLGPQLSLLLLSHYEGRYRYLTVSIMHLCVDVFTFILAFCIFPETIQPDVLAARNLQTRAQQEEQQQQEGQRPTTIQSPRRNNTSDLLVMETSHSISTIDHGTPSLLPVGESNGGESDSAQDDSCGSANNQRINKLLWYIWRPFWELSILNRNGLLRIVSILIFFSGIASSGNQTLFMYYVEEQFHFTDKDVTALLTLMGVLLIVMQGFALKPIHHCIGGGEKRLIIVGLVFGALHNLIYGLAHRKGTIFVGIVLSSFSFLSAPAISALNANHVSPMEQGRIQGAVSSLQALASAFGPLLYQFVFNHTTGSDSGVVAPGGWMFLFGACLYGTAVLCACTLPTTTSTRTRTITVTENASVDPSVTEYYDHTGTNDDDEEE